VRGLRATAENQCVDVTPHLCHVCPLPITVVQAASRMMFHLAGPLVRSLPVTQCFAFSVRKSIVGRDAMFAGSLQSFVYHLVDENAPRTVCGLPVSRFTSSKRDMGRLHLLSSQRSLCTFCKHCERLKEHEESLMAPLSHSSAAARGSSTMVR